MARRFIITILVLLTIGAIINVLIAWTCVAMSKSRMFDARHLGQLRAAQFDEEDRLMNAGKPMPANRYLALLFVGRGTRLLMIDEESPEIVLPVRTTLHDAGWPMLSMRAKQWPGPDGKPATFMGAMMGTLDLEFPQLPIASPPPRLATAGSVANAAAPVPAQPALTVAVARRQQADRLLPLQPIWPGFAVNMIIYAGVVWLCWLMFTLSMRVQRRLRQRCGHCAYPIGSSPVCTECGAAVRGHRAR